MNQLKILSQKEKQEIVRKLNKQFGIKKVKGIISMRGNERLFLFQGNFDEKEIRELERTIPIERVGVYFAKIVNEKIRLSIEGVHLLKDQITKNIFELSDKQAEEWMKGNELLFEDFEDDVEKENFFANELASGSAASVTGTQDGRAGAKKFSNKEPLGFVVIKHNDDFLGCGKASEKKITNFIPKNRRLKK